MITDTRYQTPDTRHQSFLANLDRLLNEPRDPSYSKQENLGAYLCNAISSLDPEGYKKLQNYCMNGLQCKQELIWSPEHVYKGIREVRLYGFEKAEQETIKSRALDFVRKVMYS
ncbi:hypothetical protein IT418_03785 [bacterium]|nr:hypothetical protein [bacterium]